MSSQPFIPFHAPDIGEEEIREVVDTLRSGWLTTGERVARFENAFREYCGAAHAIAVSSGTAALHASLVALGIGPGDEVITTPLTFCATVSSILHTGATPVLADVKPDGNIDPASIADRLSGRTRAILPVHLAGAPCDMRAIWDIARRKKLHVVEDAAHAAGTLYRGEPLGAMSSPSAAVAFSFYANKNITTAEGGMVVTGDAALAARIKRLSLHGMSRDAWDRYAEGGTWEYRVMEAGFKYNLSDVHAAIGIHQLRKLEKFVSERARLAALYDEAFADMPELETPPKSQDGRSAWHLYILRLNPSRLGIDRGQFIRELRRRGIGTSVHFIPIPLHPFFAPWAGDSRNQCPRAIELYERIISLPLYPGMTAEQMERVISAVREVAAAGRVRVGGAAAAV